MELDYDKAREFQDFLQFKGKSLNSIFNVKVEIWVAAKVWTPFFSEFKLQDIGFDYNLIFMSDILMGKPNLGFGQRGMNFLDNIQFNSPYIYFDTKEGKKVRLS